MYKSDKLIILAGLRVTLTPLTTVRTSVRAPPIVQCSSVRRQMTGSECSLHSGQNLPVHNVPVMRRNLDQILECCATSLVSIRESWLFSRCQLQEFSAFCGCPRPTAGGDWCTDRRGATEIDGMLRGQPGLSDGQAWMPATTPAEICASCSDLLDLDG